MLTYTWCIMLVMLLQRAAVATDRLFEIFDAEPEIRDHPTGVTPREIKGAVELRNVRFAYPGGDKLVLDDMRLEIIFG